jgi:succinyl-diaminopimelate desuccinylase
MPVDPITLLQDLLRCPSVTPADAGAQDVLVRALEPMGFTCHRLRFEAEGTPAIDNLFARRGIGGPHLCFAGHTDVVPTGDAANWTVGPFSGDIVDGRIFGRGACDMKGGVAAFVAAVAQVIDALPETASISLLITGDEEGPAINGTVKVLEWMAANGHIPDACILGEPTNPNQLGQMMKIGRRGSATGWLTVHGTQGHSAYPHLADNPLPRLVRMLDALASTTLDTGNAHFQPSTLALTTIDVGNPATNVIPAKASAAFNIRFNDEHTGASLHRWAEDICTTVGGRFELDWRVTGEAFLTPPGPFNDLVAAAVKHVTGLTPEFSTTGGTSDARFIRAYCPVVEFGLVGQSMHKIDEHAAIADVQALTAIYARVITTFLQPANA